MKSPVKEKVMHVLLDGEPHTGLELTHGAGFTRVSTIEKWIRAFETAKFITRKPAGNHGEYSCQIRQTREIARKIYYYPEFRRFRPDIRKAPWFPPLFTEGFRDLPGELPAMISEMVIRSHTFFEIIDRYDSPEKIREIFWPSLFVNEVLGVHDEEFNIWCLYYQVYLHAVIQDISGGGLGEDFMGPVQEMQDTIQAMKIVPGGARHAR